MIPEDAITAAQQAQRHAIDPRVSAWVSASAGSGKTTVLTSRVLALMLQGAAPQRILCLTFTKNAAAEMANKISKQLGKWVTENESKLFETVGDLLGTTPTPEHITRARQLFAHALDAPGGMRIETIHAFCQSLLRRFPVEAGVSPQFELMDERTAAEALADARDHVIASADVTFDAELAAALSYITGKMHETKFSEIVDEIARQRTKLERLFTMHGGVNDRGLQNAVKAMRKRLGLTNGETPAGLIEAACEDRAFDMTGLKRAIAALVKGSKSDQERASGIEIWIASPSTRIETFETYSQHFLTAKWQIRADKNLATKEACKADALTLSFMQAEAARLFGVREQIKKCNIAEATASLMCVAERMLAAYRTYKDRRSLLDYDDLIQITRKLLSAKGMTEWVLYKLDGGLDHILIDEAQDTNPEQWQIITALRDEFFAGEGRFEDRADLETLPRTFFAVGDRKQSIYSFQGADLSVFEHQREAAARKVYDATRPWQAVSMNVSFRSTEAVLKAVDLVFAREPARNGVALAGEDIKHRFKRKGQAGRVEIWPPVAPQARDEPEPWKPPIKRWKGDSPQNRLARLIARRIKAMMVDREPLPSQGRAVRAGDIMVLVRRRTSFVDELVRQLKTLEIPVAGVDRMVLPQQLAVMDLIALGRFLLLPGDDLTLATVLKSPLIGLTEEQLFDLAYPRGEKSLWEALSEHLGGDSAFGRAAQTLSDLLARTDYLTPYALFSHVLVAWDGRRKALGRLGLDADDPLDEFLGLALAYEKNHPPSLQAFLHWVEQGEIEIKRDLEQAGTDAVRIMTVHGAKGLEAPIVFMPDTLQVPMKIGVLQWTEETSPILLWASSTEEADSFTAGLRDAAKIRQMEEYRRLLYVAMTRAEDRLYVCGWRTKRTASDGNWYDIIRAGLDNLAKPVTDLFLEKEDVTESAEVLVLENTQTEPPEKSGLASQETVADVLPAWAATPAPAEHDPPRPLAPSRAAAEPAVMSPLVQDNQYRFQRGLIIHRLLQTLPDLPPANRMAAAKTFVARPGWKLPADQQGVIVAETLKVLETPDFAHVFGPGSLAEVPVVGLVGRHAVSGQVDRLAVTGDAVWIIDYKTNRPPPRLLENVDAGYVFQMAVYRDILKRIYPGRDVHCVLLWTDGTFIMELPGNMLDAALNKVAA